MPTGAAAVFEGAGKPFSIREYPVPAPAPGEILVRISRCDLCGSDLHMWRGDADLAAFGVTWGVVLGHEMVGRVEALGGGVTADATGAPLAPDDRIVWSYHHPCRRCRACLRGQLNACPTGGARMMTPAATPPHFFGGFAQYHLLPPGAAVFRAPDELSDEALAPVNCALAEVVFGLEEAALRMGEAVVVQGCGGLGLFACAVAREMGATPVIAVDLVPERLALARAFGADHIVDASEITDPRARVAEVHRLTDGWGADVVVEVVGSPDVVNEGIRMLARYGRYLEIGNISPRRTYKADPSLLVGGNKRIIGVSFYRPETLRVALDLLVRTRTRYPYDRMLSHAYPLERIDEAFQEADTFRGATTVVRATIEPWTRPPGEA